MPSCPRAVEQEFIIALSSNIDHRKAFAAIDDYRDIEAWRSGHLMSCATLFGLRRTCWAISPRKTASGAEAPARRRTSSSTRTAFGLNQHFYASLGEKRAFVLSHGRNMMILKIVGYAEQVVQYYELEDFKAHIWIAHQRYPTKGRVWHPGGAHPFIGMNEALVHNGDFANYYSVCEYLQQRNIVPLFLTDTEVSVLLFDL